MAVVATLGDIPFITYQNDFTALSSSSSYNYALQSKLEAKPNLQSVGNELDQLDFELFLHIDQVDVEQSILKLRQAAENKRPLPLVFGNLYQGNWVITDIRISVISTSIINSQSRINIARVRISLLESIDVDRRTNNRQNVININPFEFIA